MKAFLQTIPYMAVDLTCIQSKALMIHDNTLIKYTSIYLQNCFQCKRLWCWALNNITPTNKRGEGERERKISQRRCRWWKKSKFKQNLTRFFRFVVWTHFELVISKPKSNLQQFSQTETKRIFFECLSIIVSDDKSNLDELFISFPSYSNIQYHSFNRIRQNAKCLIKMNKYLTLTLLAQCTQFRFHIHKFM